LQQRKEGFQSSGMGCCPAYVSNEYVGFQCQWSTKNARMSYVPWTDQQWLDGKSG